ncbi:TetR/AcrR family transcriptional regulator [Clostridium oryzae]|uniref:HTH-type transcriptional repressor KstR2 n=1 Tax=Clostridium oryzae TaxID=1450648 RepID=A0A1V4IRV2_9CLOT|nr:TetR/AcrR family transcriptional regulator [Clostridium oryzae]OPJ62758.1 HTH-type transcriptional repressor KstR2 [Clostridium oryzae]
MAETKRELQKKLTRNKLIETAMKLFGEKGILATRTSDVAKEAGVSHGTVFAHFSTQEELICSVIEAFDNRICGKLHELVDTNSSLVDILHAHLNGLMEFEQFYTRLVIERTMLPEAANATYIMIQSTISFHMGIAAEREIKKGTIRDIPLHLLYNTWVGLIHYYITNGDLFSHDGSVLDRYGEELINHYIKLISK